MLINADSADFDDAVKKCCLRLEHFLLPTHKIGSCGFSCLRGRQKEPYQVKPDPENC